MSTAAAVDTLEALFRKVDSEVESICRDLDVTSTGDQATVGDVARRLVKVRQTFDTLKQEVETLQKERQQCIDKFDAEFQLFGELFDRLNIKVGPVPALNEESSDH